MTQKNCNQILLIVLFGLVLGFSTPVESQVISIAVQNRATPVDFRREILPLFQKSCLACHSESEANGGLVLETPASILKGGDSGPAIVAKNSSDSFLLEVASHRAEPKMPPPKNSVAAPNLTPQQLGLIKLWIDQGANDSASGNALTPEKWRSLPKRLQSIHAVAITPDGQFAACGRANQIDIYHVATGQLITRLADPALQARGPNVAASAHLDVVQSLAFNGTGDLLASGGFRVVKLWRRPSDVRLLDLPMQEAVSAVAVSPDGKTAATAALNNDIQLWSITEGKAGAVLKGHTAAVTCLYFSQGGSNLISASADKSLRAWDPATGALLGRIDTGSEINAVTIVDEDIPQTAAEGEEPAKVTIPRLVSGGGDNMLRIWQMPTSLSEQLAEIPAKSNVLAVSPDRKLLAVANSEGVVRVLEFETRKLIQTWQAHAGEIGAMAFRNVPAPPNAEATNEADNIAAPSTQLATGGADGTVRIWDYTQGESLGVLRGSVTPIHTLSWQTDGQRIVAGDEDGSVTIWNVENRADLVLTGNAGIASVAVLSPDGKLLATNGTSSERPAIILRDLATGKITRTLLGHAAPVTALAFSADSTKVISGSADKTARVWDWGDARFPEVATLAGHTGEVTAVALSTDGQQVLTGSADMQVKLWSVSDESELMNFAGHTAAVIAVGMPGNQPTSVSLDKSIRVWNPANGQQTRAASLAQVPTAMAVSHDNVQIAVASADNSLQLYNFANLQLTSTLLGHTKPISRLVFSSDNTRVLSAVEDDTAIIWNVADGRLLEILPVEAGLTTATFGANANTIILADAAGNLEQRTMRFAVALNGIPKTVTAATFNSNGTIVYTASSDGTIRGFNSANGQQTFLANHGAPIHDLAVSPDGQMLASAGDNNLIRLWNAGGAAVAPQQLAGFTGPVTSVAFSADGSRVIGAGNGDAGELLVFHLANAGELEESLVGHKGAISAVVLVGESEPRIVTASADETVRIWKLHALKRVAGHSQPVMAVAAIPGAPMQVLSGSRDNTVRHWNLINGQALRQMNHGGPVLSVAVRSDGARFASVSENHVGRLWDAANGQQLGEMRGDIRAKNIVAKLTQQQRDVTAKVTATKVTLTAAEALVPTRTATAKTAADALAKANADVAAKVAALKQASETKTAAEQKAIVAAAAAQKAAALKAAADLAVTEATEAVQIATVKLTRAKAVAAASPENAQLAQAAAAAQVTLDQANAKLTAANAAKAAPTKMATDTAAAAAAAATAAIATGKPFLDATNALRASETTQKTAEQASQFADRDAKAASDAVPVIKAELTAAETMLAKLTMELEAATKAAAAAEQPLRAVAFSPDNLQLATGGDFGAVHTWNADTGVAIASYTGHQGPVQSIAFVSGANLLTGSVDKSVGVWDLNPGWVLERTIGQFDDPTTLVNRVTSLDFSDDGELLATGGGVPSRSGELKLWKVVDGSLALDIPEPHTDIVYGLSISQDGRFVATAGGDKYVRTFDVATGHLVQQFEGHTDHALDVSWRADGKVLASCGADNMVMVWNPENGDRFRTYGGYNKQVSAVRFVGGTNLTVSCSADGNLRLHNSDNGGVVSSFAGTKNDFLYSVDVTPDRQFVVGGGFDGIFRIWNGNAANSQPLQELTPPRDVDPEPAAADAVAEGSPAK